MAIWLRHIRRSGAERQQHCDAAAPIEATAVVNQKSKPTTNPYKTAGDAVRTKRCAVPAKL